MSKMRIFMFFMFYISVASCFFLLSKWASQNSVNANDPWNRKPVDVFITLVLAAHVLVFVKVLPRKEAITNFLTNLHAMGDSWVIGFCFNFLELMAEDLVMAYPGRIETWVFCSFFLALVCFVVLHATSEVSHSFCLKLHMQTLGMLVKDLLRSDFLSAFVAGVVCFVSYMVVRTEFGGAA